VLLRYGALPLKPNNTYQHTEAQRAFLFVEKSQFENLKLQSSDLLIDSNLLIVNIRSLQELCNRAKITDIYLTLQCG